MFMRQNSLYFQSKATRNNVGLQTAAERFSWQIVQRINNRTEMKGNILYSYTKPELCCSVTLPGCGFLSTNLAFSDTVLNSSADGFELNSSIYGIFSKYGLLKSKQIGFTEP